MRINKGELIKKAREAESEALKLEGKGAAGKNFWLDEAKKLQPEIDALSRRADPLAVKFKDCYRRAREAFENDEKELAAQLKEDGYPYETECRALNGKANELRFYLDGLNKKYKSLYNKADELYEKSLRYIAKAAEIRDTAVINFPESQYYSNDEIEDFLDLMPRVLFKKIKSISYVDKPRYFTDRVSGQVFYDESSLKAKIEIYGHLFKEEMKRTIVHEIGHVAYEYFLSEDDKMRFECLESGNRAEKHFVSDYAPKSIKESFCECSAVFKINPQKVKDYDEDIYNFIKEIYIKYE